MTEPSGSPANEIHPPHQHGAGESLELIIKQWWVVATLQSTAIGPIVAGYEEWCMDLGKVDGGLIIFYNDRGECLGASTNGNDYLGQTLQMITTLFGQPWRFVVVVFGQSVLFAFGPTEHVLSPIVGDHSVDFVASGSVELTAQSFKFVVKESLTAEQSNWLAIMFDLIIAKEQLKREARIELTAQWSSAHI